MNFSSKQYAAEAEHFSTAISIANFTPLSTPGDQRITVGHAKIGKLEVNDGSIVFGIDSARSILVEKTEWGWAGGNLYTDAFRFDPGNPSVNVVAYANNVSIEQVLKLTAGADAGGAGTLYGRLPVTVNWPSIEFGTGFLYAVPGPGRLNLGAAAAAKADTMLSHDPRFSSGPQVQLIRSRVISALRNFHYDLLKVDFTHQGQNLTASAKLDGFGVIGKDKQELHLELNANGFDKLLRDALVIKSILK